MLHKSLLMATVLFAVSSSAFAQQSPMPPAGSAPPPPQGQRQSPFERADANRDGVITLEEVRIARTAAFTRLDANRDGFLVREEMPRPQERRMGGPDGGPPRSERPMEMSIRGGDLLRQSDANNDGNVTRAEFDAGWARFQAANASAIEAARARMFARLDTNNDGTITRAEADAGRGKFREVRVEKRGEGQRHGPGHPNPDTNNDEKISLSEWLARPDPLFERGDVNKDGRVTREEAASVVRERRITVSSSKRPW